MVPVQQPGQFAAVQLAWHVPMALHDCAALHVVHAPPLRPHMASAVPPTHVVPWQQPAQLPGPHVGVTHALPVHTRPVVVHVAHAAPAVPHAVSWLPVAQRPSLRQQPVGQVMALQTGVVTQLPPVHVEPVPHVEHAAPPRPHAVVSPPVTQRSPMQQPEQLVELHDGAPAQRLPVPQVWPVALQSAHSEPPVPHVAFCVPPTQLLPTQQPGHVLALHVAPPQLRVAASQRLPPLAQLVHDLPPMPQAAS